MKRKATHTGLEMSPQGQLLYKQIMDNMTFIKRQQWATTNYAVLIYAAIVYLHEKASKLDSALSVVAVLTAIFAIGLLVWFQCDLRSLRKRIERADNSYFNDAEKFALEIKEKDEWPFLRGGHILLALVLVCGVGATIVYFTINPK